MKNFLIIFFCAFSAIVNAQITGGSKIKATTASGIVTTTISNISGTIFIKDYSPAGDGVTDDSIPFYNAISYANANNIKLILLEGKSYRVSGLYNPFGVEFIGGGKILKDTIQLNNYTDRSKVFFGIEYLSHFHKLLIATTPVKSIFGGDSTTEEGGLDSSSTSLNFVPQTQRILQLLAGVTISNKNAGHSGKTSADWVNTYLNQDSTYLPDLYVIKYGINDPYLGGNITTFQNNIENGLKRLRSWKSDSLLSIVLMTPNSTSESSSNRDERWHESINLVLRSLARKYRCAFFDTYGLAKDSRNAYNYMDKQINGSIHPQGVMDTWIASELVNQILPLGLRSQTQINLSNYAKTTNISGVSVDKNAADLPATYPTTDISVYRSSNAANNGFLLTFKTVDSSLLQLSYAFNTNASPKFRYGSAKSSVNSWNGWNTDNIETNTVDRSLTDLPDAFVTSTSAALAINRASAFPSNGAVFTIPQANGIALQLNYAYNGSNALYYRAGWHTTWNSFEKILSNVNLSSTPLNLSTGAITDSLVTSSSGNLTKNTLGNLNFTNNIYGAGNSYQSQIGKQYLSYISDTLVGTTYLNRNSVNDYGYVGFYKNGTAQTYNINYYNLLNYDISTKTQYNYLGVTTDVKKASRIAGTTFYQYSNFVGFTLYDVNNNGGSVSFDTLNLKLKGANNLPYNIQADSLIVKPLTGINFQGVKYAADYSANYTTRSLIDKAYVDAATVNAAKTTNISGVYVDKNSADLPATYPNTDISVYRSTTAANNGFILTFRTVDSSLLQLNYAFNTNASPKFRYGSAKSSVNYWNGWNTDNIETNTIDRSTSDLPDAFVTSTSAALAINRASAFPSNGAVFTIPQANGIALQLNYAYNGSNALYYRAGWHTSWNSFEKILSNVNLSSTPLNLSTGANTDSLVTSNAGILKRYGLIGNYVDQTANLTTITTNDTVVTQKAVGASWVIQKSSAADLVNAGVKQKLPQGGLTVSAAGTTQTLIITNSIAPLVATDITHISIWNQSGGTGAKLILIPTVDFTLTSISGNNINIVLTTAAAVNDKLYVLIK